MMLLPAAFVQGTTVNLSDKHVSIYVPANWTSQRNYTTKGVTYDLWIEGPVSGGYRPLGDLSTRPWLGSITDNTLYTQMTYAIDGAKTTYGSSNVQVVSAPANITLNGEHASDATVLVAVSGVTFRERWVIVISGAWHQAFGLSLEAVDTQWSDYSDTFSTIVNSITIAEKENAVGGQSMRVIVGIGVAVVVVVAVVLLAVRKKRQTVVILPPQAQIPPQAGQPSAPSFGIQTFCPYCGSPLQGAIVCRVCGRSSQR
jgi:hypothetical protein